MDEAGKAAFEYTKTAFGHLVTGLQHVKWEDLPAHVRDHIIKNPGITCFQLIMLLLACVPVLVAAPGLAALGFGALGPTASQLTGHRSCADRR